MLPLACTRKAPVFHPEGKPCGQPPKGAPAALAADRLPRLNDIQRRPVEPPKPPDRIAPHLFARKASDSHGTAERCDFRAPIGPPMAAARHAARHRNPTPATGFRAAPGVGCRVRMQPARIVRAVDNVAKGMGIEFQYGRFLKSSKAQASPGDGVSCAGRRGLWLCRSDGELLPARLERCLSNGDRSRARLGARTRPATGCRTLEWPSQWPSRWVRSRQCCPASSGTDRAEGRVHDPVLSGQTARRLPARPGRPCLGTAPLPRCVRTAIAHHSAQPAVSGTRRAIGSQCGNTARFKKKACSGEQAFPENTLRGVNG